MSGYVRTRASTRSRRSRSTSTTARSGVAQALAAEGIRPPAESVRSEEWVNALPYDDPAPTETDLALRARRRAWRPSLDDGTQQVRVGRHRP